MRGTNCGILNEGALTLQTVIMVGNRAFGVGMGPYSNDFGNGGSMGIATGRNLPERLSDRSLVTWVFYTYPFNLTGQPAASICAGLTVDAGARRGR